MSGDVLSYIILGIILVAVAAVIVFSIRRRGKTGSCAGCSCGCSHEPDCPDANREDN